MRKVHILAQRAPACPDCGAVLCDCANDHLPVEDTLPTWLDALGTAFTFVLLAGCCAVAFWSV